LNKLATSQNKTLPLLSKDVEIALQNYTFPGNIRELENILERAFALCDGKVITLSDLQLPVSAGIRLSGGLEHYLDDVERQAIIQALEQTAGNKSQAARKLGITFRALRYRLKKYDLE
ncbi:MAG TPA: helix-turn-helix domain-containing protein, partial [Gammaproteobacteria bacterium]|nr:helix-turn-helix domain-containing protein [Gammaproteobacteria bacterium]